ncbi:hypothetical protein GWO43_12505 [candidate division KSB1 bacterium]|nr:hypothetical protein [candidate division KSB1 bacterium]NIS24937.1 hypothetical protein [candidate division KSB1 bacterium]NIT71683.1 hypothetical protein [candidate division KSB1 bacterium]NIU25901.1 hypothetical protein [candidate division KSB1 bacterium]NIU92189.1 hypothetical protein [candidate division KSB1 bacterium]
MNQNGNQRGIEAVIKGHDPAQCLDRAKANAQACQEFMQALRAFEQATIKFEKSVGQPVQTAEHSSMVEYAKRDE